MWDQVSAVFQKGWGIIFAFIFVVIIVLVLNGLMPSIFEGHSAVSNTTNAGEYAGLLEFNDLAPLLIFLGIFGAGIYGIWLAVFGRKEKRHPGEKIWDDGRSL